MSGTPVVTAGEDTRPRNFRRDIHSCAECKRRKIRCQPGMENGICVGCLNRGAVCVVQQAQREDGILSMAQFEEKLNRIQSLLQRLVENDVSSAFAATLSASPVNLSRTYESHSTDIADSASAAETSPNGAFSKNPKVTNGVGQLHGHMDSKNFGQSRKLEEIRQRLSSLLPSQYDADLIGQVTNSWALAQVFCTPSNDLFNNGEPLSSFNLAAVSRCHPTIIARTLIYIAICIQQLPSEFDTTRLQSLRSLDAVMEKYVLAVVNFVTSDDELATTMEGLECLLLHGLFHLYAGSLRRAWLSFRRALNIAQLMGLDKDFMKAREGYDSISTKAGKQMWHQVVMSDRFVSLHLRLPSGTGEDCFGPEEKLNSSTEDVDLIFERKLTLIAGRVSKRNQVEPTHIYSQTRVIDEDMERLANEMPKSWWNVPQPDGTSRSRGVAQQFNRITAQIWYYQMVTLLHLPFMLRAVTESRYEYNRHTCLRASREILFRYMALRNANNTQFVCRVVDFAAFIAAVVIALASIHMVRLSEGVQSQQRSKDMVLLQDIIGSMKILAESGGREFVAKQSVVVLKALLEFNDPSGASNGNLRLTVPYFGTININRPTPIPGVSPIKSGPPIGDGNSRKMISMVQPDQARPSEFINAKDLHSNPVGIIPDYTPVLSFVSSQFRSLEPEPSAENWEWQENETLFFDSIVSSDIGGFDPF